MNRTALTVTLAQVLLTAGAVVMSIRAGVPWPGTAGLGILGFCAMAVYALPSTAGKQVWRWGIAVAWTCTLTVPASLLLIPEDGFTFDKYSDRYFAALAWLIASALLAMNRRMAAAALTTRWKGAAMTLALFGGFVWVASSYSENLSGMFHIGLLLGLVLLIVWKSRFRLPMFVIQAANTLILFFVVLPIVDLFVRSHDRLVADPEPGKKYYSYAVSLLSGY